MDNPVDFLETPQWKRPKSAAEIIQALEQVGFRTTPECCEIKAMNLLALGLLHKNENHFAVVYEDADNEPWFEIGIQAKRCKIGADAWGKKYFIASSAADEREWVYDSKEIIRKPGALPSELFQQVEEMSQEIVADKQELMMFSILLHDRMYQQWRFLDKNNDPNKIHADNDNRNKRISKWVGEFVKFFRPLGFLKATETMPDKKLTQMILDYDEPLFKLCPGTLAVVDDYDEFSDFLTNDDLESIPKSTQSLDLKILAILDPDRVWWSFRVWHYEQGYQESDIKVDGEQFIKSLAKISNGHFDPESVSETQQKEGQSEIKISLGGKTHQLKNNFVPSTDYDSRDAGMMVSDMKILSAINKIILGDDMRFELFRYDDGEGEFQEQYIILLSKKDRAILKEKRGWKFS